MTPKARGLLPFQNKKQEFWSGSRHIVAESYQSILSRLSQKSSCIFPRLLQNDFSRVVSRGSGVDLRSRVQVDDSVTLFHSKQVYMLRSSLAEIHSLEIHHGFAQVTRDHQPAGQVARDADNLSRCSPKVQTNTISYISILSFSPHTVPRRIHVLGADNLRMNE